MVQLASVTRTMAAPTSIIGLGRSPVPSQTQNGPSTISSSINRLTLVGAV